MTIISGVVLGGRYDHLHRKGHATVKSGALLGANAVVLGTVTIGGIDLHQINNGPLFGEYTEEVLSEVFV